MKADTRPVFHDPTGRRRRWTLRVAVALGAVFLAIAGVFLLSLVAIPVLPRTLGLSEPMRRALRPHLAAPRPATDPQRFLLANARRRLLEEAAREAREARRTRSGARRTAAAPPTIVAAFYATWQETGLHSLRANAPHLTHLFPLWLRIGADARSLDTRDWNLAWTPHNRDVLRIANEHRIQVMPVLSNAHEGVFDTRLAHEILTRPANQQALAVELRDWLVQHRFAGVNLDLENLSESDTRLVPAFLHRLARVLRPAGLAISADLEAEGNVPDAGAVAREVDFVVLMAYDQHFMAGEAGPLCAVDWFRDVLDRTLAKVPADKLVVGIGNYAYDWTEGRPPAESLTYQEALFLAADYRPEDRPADVVDFDSLALNPTFEYDDEQGREHEVWLLDAVTAANQRRIAAERGAGNAAVWVLGSEDPALWTFLDRSHPGAEPDSAALARTSFPYDVEFQGDGELLTVAAAPQEGVRELARDPASGLYTDESYRRYPTSYLIQRGGFRPMTLALTFDDGPSGRWTPAILDALGELGVPATFFVIGENAERHPDLIRREWDEGHEIGNHTYTHPNIAAVSKRRVHFELNATQRALQSDIGHSTLMFRPPYNADAEPTSAEEVQPMLDAAALGYFTVGEYIDAQDWRLRDSDGRLRTPEAIADEIIGQVHAGHGNVVLLHDGGGDRSATLAALRLIVPRLKAEGYRFVSVSELKGFSRDQAMPPVSVRDRALIGGDRVAFDLLYWVGTFLSWAFLAGIVLGAARVVVMTVLALLARRAERRRRRVDAPLPTVSVLIAAYDERPVIARTIEAVLAGSLAPLEVVVVDDGSRDGTADEVERIFGADPRVRLLRQANAGKAAALNRAIEASHGEVLVCLDADTLFARDTLDRLAAHFADPHVGAVAGNVKVGNRVNVWTRWQALEYITSQNLDRRAYALLDAVTVVPGAVGAWRRSAVASVGGFRSDTLAEDMDLTWRLHRGGWRIENDPGAAGFTEAPDSLQALYRQRFRWSFGTLQCLWKHRGAFGRHGGFGRFALPSLWLFQIGFQTLSPIIDLQVLVTLVSVAQGYFTRALLTQDWQPLPQAVESLSTVGFLYLFFFLLELLGAVVAVWMERERKRLLWWLFWQRFVYRQVMYAVVWRALRTALTGHLAGWDKLERRNTATLEPS
ncbi:MAG: glycosyltransferase [Candidatus Eisenbacteria bacterium]|nr:glycosyltransferase [Candidatus Eisenbacteria bacterium]